MLALFRRLHHRSSDDGIGAMRQAANRNGLLRQALDCVENGLTYEWCARGAQHHPLAVEIVLRHSTAAERDSPPDHGSIREKRSQRISGSRHDSSFSESNTFHDTLPCKRPQNEREPRLACLSSRNPFSLECTAAQKIPLLEIICKEPRCKSSPINQDREPYCKLTRGRLNGAPATIVEPT